MKAKLVKEFTEDSDPIKDMGIGGFDYFFKSKIDDENNYRFYPKDGDKIYYVYYTNIRD